MIYASKSRPPTAKAKVSGIAMSAGVRESDSARGTLLAAAGAIA